MEEAKFRLDDSGEFYGVIRLEQAQTVLRIGLLDGSEHHIQLPAGASIHTPNGQIKIGKRTYGAWAWWDTYVS